MTDEDASQILPHALEATARLVRTTTTVSANSFEKSRRAWRHALRTTM
jgi:hypothetical protein